jgi:hypothetical protein
MINTITLSIIWWIKTTLRFTSRNSIWKRNVALAANVFVYDLDF